MIHGRWIRAQINHMSRGRTVENAREEIKYMLGVDLRHSIQHETYHLSSNFFDPLLLNLRNAVSSRKYKHNADLQQHDDKT